MRDDDGGRTEWLVTMLRLQKSNPAAYERLIAEAWEMIAEDHRQMTPEQLAAWLEGAS